MSSIKKIDKQMRLGSLEILCKFLLNTYCYITITQLSIYKQGKAA